MKTYVLIVNGLGIGIAPDYSRYQQVQTNTFKRVAGSMTLPVMAMLGFYNIYGSGNTDENDICATHARVRMLGNRVGFDAGLNEILGNICDYDKPVTIRDNLLSRLKNFGFEVAVLGKSGVIEPMVNCDNDRDIMRYVVTNSEGKDVFVAVFNGFAESLLEGKEEKAREWLVDFDTFLGQLLIRMGDDDLLIAVGNQGIDIDGAQLSREYSPIVVYCGMCPIERDLGTVQGLSCVAMTVVDHLGVYNNENALLSSRVIDDGLGIDVRVAMIKNKIGIGNVIKRINTD